MRKQNDSILNFLSSKGIHVDKRTPKVGEKPKERSLTVRTNLNTARTGQEYRRDYELVKAGHYYILEIVRPNTTEMKRLYGLDEIRSINGRSRIVSKQRMYVSKVRIESNRMCLDCIGMDRYGRRADGVYVFYQTPDPTNKRDTYVQSITRC